MADPKNIGKYEILEEIGCGGFAVVYKARDPDLDRAVALKVLAPHLTWDPTFAGRFRREAQTTAKLSHPHIVTIYEVGQDGERLYIAMQYLPGRTLASLLEAEDAIRLDRALPILEQVADALDYAHGQGVIHRDVKPSNVMVEETGRGIRATLMDFGLVKAMESSKSLTSLGAVLGSPEYMAPEQVDPNRKGEIGSATDRYALGVVAYEMVVGQVPFPGSTPSTLVAHMEQAPPDPQSICAALPVSVAQVLLKALSKSPSERYPTAVAMVEALRTTVEPHPEPELHSSLTIGLAVKPRTVDVNGEATWTATVLNDGDNDLHHVIVRRGHVLLDKPFELVAGEHRRFTFITTYATKGKKEEKVIVTGIATNGESVHGGTSVTVQVREPHLEISEPRPELKRQRSIKKAESQIDGFRGILDNSREKRATEPEQGRAIGPELIPQRLRIGTGIAVGVGVFLGGSVLTSMSAGSESILYNNLVVMILLVLASIGMGYLIYKQIG